MTAKAKGLFDAFNRAAPRWSDALFEEVFQIAGESSGYQDVKALVLEAEDQGQYPAVVENYAKELKNRHGNLPMEFWEIGRKYQI